MTIENALICYFGHHRCSSTWISEIVRQFAAETGRSFRYIECPNKFSNDLKAFVQVEGVQVLAYANASYQHVRQLDNIRGFHVIRDPRDIITSSYFSHLHSHPVDDWLELAEHRRKLRSLSKEKGIELEMEFSRFVLDDIRTWNYSQPDVLELRMEEIILSPFAKFLEIFDFINVVGHDKSIYERVLYEIIAITNRMYYSQKYYLFMPFRIRQKQIIAEHLLSILYKKRFYRLSKGRMPGEQNVRSHYRMGLAGDWANHFSPSNVKAFKERYNDIVLHLGYEKEEDWDIEQSQLRK